MMPVECAKIRIDELFRVKSLPFAPLQYLGPHLSRWGVINTALMVPESVGLLVGPAGCLREPFFDARKKGNSERLFSISLSENDVIMGDNFQSVKSALIKIAEKKKPHAIFLCTVCVDEILGTDYEGIAREVESTVHIPVIVVKKNPICKEKNPPMEQRTYSLFNKFLLSCHNRKTPKNERTVNILGGYTPVSRESELYTLLSRAGYSILNQIIECDSFAQFKSLNLASHNIVVHPRGILLAQEMETYTGTPFCFVPASFELNGIEENYRKIEIFLQTEFDITSLREDAERYLQANIHRFVGKKIAIGSGINGSPFELAQALIEYGLEVTAIFSENVHDYEWDYISWLSKKYPSLFVYKTSHPSLKEYLGEWNDIDIAIGLDAGYYCAHARVVSLPLDVQGYGYQHLKYLLDEMSRVIDSVPPQI